MKLKIELTGTTPLLMHNPRMVDPEYPINRELKALTAKRKKTDDDRRQIERLEWIGGLYEDGGVVVQPTSKVRKCLINTAKISKLGKSVERAISFSTLYIPLIYDGPREIKEIEKDERFVSRLSVGIGNKRVMRVRPKFAPWALVVTGLFIEDAGLDVDELVRIVELAGTVEGIGDARAIGYGRFEGKVTVTK